MGNDTSNLDPAVISRAFKMYDDNEDGKIESSEFCASLNNQGFHVDEKLCQLCFSLVDTDGSNYIDQKEFHNFFVAYTKLENPDIYDLIGCAADVNGDDTIDGKELKRVLDFKHVKMVEEMNKKSMITFIAWATQTSVSTLSQSRSTLLQLIKFQINIKQQYYNQYTIITASLFVVKLSSLVNLRNKNECLGWKQIILFQVILLTLHVFCKQETN
ncbi:Conserved_hypothetical protein [Hexamita inflata]|uniref:EF-hand domain-containing protein n=1 Tax=Hexamita inflata TaxID=28002 RepID=A0AA86NPN5_9EUKA|nr:Conserved hypothetical protein [Hexamita inflata]